MTSLNMSGTEQMSPETLQTPKSRTWLSSEIVEGGGLGVRLGDTCSSTRSITLTGR